MTLQRDNLYHAIENIMANTPDATHAWRGRGVECTPAFPAVF